jgi:nitrate reductase beta subunit
LPPDKWEELLRVGLAETEEYDTGRGTKKHLAARWTLQTTYYWEQTFAGRAETLIEHRYKPSVGTTVQTALGAPDAAKEPWYDEYKDKYCFDYEFLAAVERARKAANGKFGGPFSEERIDYILKTGANWSGPIKDFRLVVDKGAPDNLVSFCGDDVRKIGETQFEMKKTDYTPDGNLSILILKKLP